ncbi:peptide/nickel transport system substrate-binding protein [Devosia enhydra]|uniref:Peptide/nickel transport system substrate-binding protein n=1 Tax=Devosia enhydra TaxID=665118 RepID=A0A1K2HXU6_9HYPH|nr:ABC transporter substrate-binding protein [Devosia enhydra]SFZ84612.1 peptide/nickel transport system substrate-binding protein [Devosia enhydra]
MTLGTKKNWSSGILALTMTAAIAGSAGAAEGELVIALPSAPTSVDACDDSTNANARVLRGNVVEALTRLNPDAGGEVLPLLATEWTRVDDTNWLFTLRDGVTFHDGAKLDAEAAVYAINRIMNAELNCNTLPLIRTPTKASVESEMVVRITTEAPDPIVPARMAYIDLPSPSTPLNAKAETPVGTGPYKFVSRDPGQSIVLEAIDGYWGEPVAFAKATYVWRGEPTIRAAMVKTGEADIAIDIPYHEAQGQPNAQEYSTNSVFFLRPMIQKAPFDDLRVRQALVSAIDKDLLTEVLMENSATPASQLVSPLINGYLPDYEGLGYDLDKAKALLAEAKADGVAVDTPIELISRTDLFSGVGEVSQAIQQMLEAAGFTVKLVSVDSVAWSPWARKPDSLTQPVNLLTVTHDNISGDASMSFPTYFGTEARLSMSTDAELHARLMEAATLVGEERTAAYRAIAETAYGQEIIVPIAALQSRLLTSGKVSYEANGFTDIEIHLSDVTHK